MSKFFEDLKDKAQSAISSTPLAAYVPGREGTQPSQGSGRSHALDSLQHQIRSLQVQYGSGASKDLRQLQLIITGQKGVVLGLEKGAQDAKQVSKEFYIWGQAENTDVKDVTDRLAYLTAPLKALRDAEAHMQPKRNVRINYELQITRLKNEGKPGTQQKLRELESMLKKAEKDDEPFEQEIEFLKRKAIVESETQKWQALREYGEKLVLLSQACGPFLEALPPVPPTNANPYAGATATAATRATLQKALDTYKPGNFTLPPSGAESETRSFGETHASELSRISSVADHHDMPPHRTSPSPPLSPLSQGLPPQPTAQSRPTGASDSAAASTPIKPLSLNNAPAAIPSGLSATPAEPQSPCSVPANTPTVAETGVPVAAGSEGPGPASGSLAGGRGASQDNASSTVVGPGYGESAPSYGSAGVPKYGLNDKGFAATYESAEDEKRRLERENRERVLRGSAPPSSFQPSSGAASTSVTVTHETAEDEKRRLEREERERVLRAGGSGSVDSANPVEPDVGGDGNVPPPYEEPR